MIHPVVTPKHAKTVSGLPQFLVRERNAWKHFLTDEQNPKAIEAVAKLKAMSMETKFFIYRSLDKDVQREFIDLCKQQDETCDTDELMYEAGRIAVETFLS